MVNELSHQKKSVGYSDWIFVSEYKNKNGCWLSVKVIVVEDENGDTG